MLGSPYTSKRLAGAILAFLEEQLEQPAQITGAFPLPISDLWNCFLDLRDSNGTGDPGTCIDRSLQVSKWPHSPFCTSLKFPSNVYAATSFFYCLSTRCPAFSLLRTCTLACIFCLDIFRLTQRLLCWLAHLIHKLSSLPTIFPPETLHMAPRRGMRSIRPPTPLLVLRGRAEAGEQQRLELETPPHSSDSHPSLGQGHHNGCNCLSGNTLMQCMVLFLVLFPWKTIDTASCKR